jgi:hypothetical protein
LEDHQQAGLQVVVVVQLMEAEELSLDLEVSEEEELGEQVQDKQDQQIPAVVVVEAQ